MGSWWLFCSRNREAGSEIHVFSPLLCATMSAAAVATLKGSAMDKGWLLDESSPLTNAEALEATQRTLGFDRATEPAINVALYDITILDTRKWFGKADVRLDALVVTPGQHEDQLFHANTFPFSGVRNGETLPLDRATGLAVYTGWPQYFLDLTLMASRSVPGQKSLAGLIADSADQFGSLLGSVAALTAAAPQAAAITAAGAAAAKLGSSILRALDGITGSSIGLYRATWYEHRHRFGLGQHPADGGRFRVQDLEFRYEVFQDRPGSA